MAECDVCQKVKCGTWPPSGLLHPLPITNIIWKDFSMNFIEGFPMSDGHEMILVVVYRFIKYRHFILIKHPYTSKSVAKAVIANVVKLYGFPKSIVTDRDQVFISTL